ncbi:hypothetical protein [Kamptonema formosum]|uniref:hypothetical protein n=1 Tax=Kamptonema formosum TaxID=331992 RepID=UPI0012DC05E6|nr:hypothetical protein [Oscillatoria sp. PCC 10802]
MQSKRGVGAGDMGQGGTGVPPVLRRDGLGTGDGTGGMPVQSRDGLWTGGTGDRGQGTGGTPVLRLDC